MQRSAHAGGDQVVHHDRSRRAVTVLDDHRSVALEAQATLPPAAGPRPGAVDADHELAVWMDHVRFHRTRCPAVRARLVEEYTGYAIHLAHRFTRSAELRDDLVQVALEALVVALDRFEPDRRTPFLGFASPTISGALKRYHRDNGWALRVPRRVHELAKPIRQATDMLTQDLGREPTDDEIADLLCVPVLDVRSTRAATVARRVEALDLGSIATGPSHVDPSYARIDDLAAVQAAVAELTEQGREILAAYYGAGESQRVIAERLGISQMQVSRTLSQALAQLRSRVPS